MHGVQPSPNSTPSSGAPARPAGPEAGLDNAAGEAEPVEQADEQQAQHNDQAPENLGETLPVLGQCVANAGRGGPLQRVEHREAEDEQQGAEHDPAERKPRWLRHGGTVLAGGTVPAGAPGNAGAAPAVLTSIRSTGDGPASGHRDRRA